MARNANYSIVLRQPDRIVLKDVGPWDRYMTITNAAEDVVQELINNGDLGPKQRLFYYDSEGDYSELDIKDGKFIGFRPAVQP